MWGKEILNIDEARFSHVCSAILELEGFRTKAISPDEELGPAERKRPDLIIASYPFRNGLLSLLRARLKKSNIPLIVLSDTLSDELLMMLDNLDNAYCMIKPLDYQRFRSLVTKVMSGEINPIEGYSIV